MKSLSFVSHIFLNIHCLLFLATTLNSLWFVANTSAHALGNKTDHSALLKFKESISVDPYGILDSWNSSFHFCNWPGITCGLKHRRVTKLNLPGYELYGSISPHLGNLSFMRYIDLGSNSFYGEIPQQLSGLSRLQILYLTNNSLTGEIPTNLTRCSDFRVLDFSSNKLVGKIPIEIGSLWKLREVFLDGNNLIGQIPPSICNLTSLTQLWLAANNLQGRIPQELGRLTSLRRMSLSNNSLTGEIPTNLTSCSELTAFDFSWNNLIGKLPLEIGSLWKLEEVIIQHNNLTGQIPSSIGKLSSLTSLSLTGNKLEGNIPQEICLLKNMTILSLGSNNLSGTFASCLYNMSSLMVLSLPSNQLKGSLPPNMFNNLPNLDTFEIGENHISGTIPTSIINASLLEYVELRANQFVGQVPSLGKLEKLQYLSMGHNNLGGDPTKDLEFLKSLTNCSNLNVLAISGNNFGGQLPKYSGNFSTQLSRLYIGDNQIYGKIPAELGNLVNLNVLILGYNHFDGIIPATFGKFKKIQWLSLQGNKLSGDFPTFIGNLSQLIYLYLSENMLEASISPSIGNCQKLQELGLFHNNLGGAIPPEVFSLASLTTLLDLSKNSFSGDLPAEVGNLKNLNLLDVSENHLTSDIPGSIGECQSMEYLYLQGNSFHGIIPSSLTSLKGLQELDLSRNRLSGSIPQALQNFMFLEYLNVSFNMLEGEVPTRGVFGNASTLAVAGNTKLCGGISELHLPPCPVKDGEPAKHHHLKVIAMIVSVVVFLLLMSLTLTIYWMRKRNKKPNSDSPTINRMAKVSYQNLHHGTDGFSFRHLMGSGNFGSVYKGTLESEDRVVAIKVFNLQKKTAEKSFIAECNALKNIRHRNLVKIITCCSSTDYEGQEFKALVFEFMENGSLESWLHPVDETANQSNSLDLEQRLNIINDVATAVHYLHYECEQAIIHCDLKPSNILLDDCMVARVSDFGLARLLPTVGLPPMQSSTIGIKGTIGYAPPEYGMSSDVSIEGDMYSFGILILEMLTGRRPTDEMFKDDHNLHDYVKISLPDHLLQILDPTIFPKELEQVSGIENLGVLHPNIEKCLLSLFRIALACSVASPKERMNITDVLRELNQIKRYFSSGGRNGG